MNILTTWAEALDPTAWKLAARAPVWVVVLYISRPLNCPGISQSRSSICRFSAKLFAKERFSLDVLGNGLVHGLDVHTRQLVRRKYLPVGLTTSVSSQRNVHFLVLCAPGHARYLDDSSVYISVYLYFFGLQETKQVTIALLTVLFIAIKNRKLQFVIRSGSLTRLTLIVSAHPFCAGKFARGWHATSNVTYRAHTKKRSPWPQFFFISETSNLIY